ncbi:TQXA domain-containing protein [Streptomyces sp. NPDC048172]|uniref:TQXA domain-containing protein n=1 Tax=Streptomyces sp. NPDC048172 TaxID=3365505 RepID=UPI0037108FFB
MTSARGRLTGRLTAVAVASGLLAAGMAAGAGTAVAGGGPEQRGGATATLDGLTTYGEAVVRSGGERQEVSAGLFEMSVEDGGTLQTYGVDMLNPTQDQTRYQETDWKSSPLHGNRNAGKIRWIAQHSYPRMNDLDALAKAAGAKKLTARTAAAGTQVAIWRFSERAARGAEAPRVDAVDPAAERLADFLVKKARSAAEPKASLALDPAGVSGKSGDRLGPVTVRTGAPGVTVTPGPDTGSQGVRIVDEKGKRVDSARDGSRLYFDVPRDSEPGGASLTVQAATKVPVGRVFTGTGVRGRSQAQILAGSSQSTVSAEATVDWADSGAIPAADAAENCAKGGVDITVANKGDAPFPLRVGGQRKDVAEGRTGKVTVPVKEDQPYRIPVDGPHGYEKTFSGVLDCAPATSQGELEQRSAGAGTERPATVGGGGERPMGGSTDLAQTGSGGDTSLIVGAALAFLAIGAATIVAVRRREG